MVLPPKLDINRCCLAWLPPQNSSPFCPRVQILNLREPSGSHQHTRAGEFRALGKRVQGWPGTGLSFGGSKWEQTGRQPALGLKEDRKHLGNLIPFILINMTTADTTMLSTHNTQKWGLSSFQGNESGECGFPNGAEESGGCSSQGQASWNPTPWLRVSRFPIIQDSCPIPI